MFSKLCAYIKKIKELKIIPVINFRVSFIFIYLNIILYDFKRYNITTDKKGKIKYDIKLLVLAGYMRLLSQNFVNSLPSKFIVNVHPSLLPKYKGMNAIKQAIDDCAEYTGVTIHYVDEGMDSGTIIKQDSIKINENDTVETLKERLQTIEHRLYADTIKSILIKN